MSEKTAPATPGTRVTRLLLVFAAVAVVAAIGAAALLVTVVEHKQEAKNPFFRVVEITDDIDDPAVWGKNFPLQFDLYRKTVDMVRTRFGGSEAVQRTPSQADPRSLVSTSRLEDDPRLKTIWAGYAFAVDFREERGHAFMLEDQTFTERQQVVQQPGTCMNCHASIYTTYKKLGQGDLVKGFEAVNQMPYSEARTHVEHPVACIDCHDPASMQLRITRPAFMEGMRALKASQGVADYDVNRDATRQEMRAFVCGQCHVEYYFKGKEKRLVYPWAKGLKVDNIQAYYDEVGHKDWTHKESGAPALKAQHPEFEMWNQGVHARAGVACADCHMPYTRVGAFKISDHHVRSPLLNINKACQTCHNVPEAELKGRAEEIQGRTFALRNQAMDAVVALIGDLQAARAAGLPEAALAAAQQAQREAQFRLDFVEAENSTGFHAPGEAARILAESMNLARQGQIALRDAGYRPPPAAPVKTAALAR
jgi:nitrite reductase (cytochrome c-552)